VRLDCAATSFKGGAAVLVATFEPCAVMAICRLSHYGIESRRIPRKAGDAEKNGDETSDVVAKRIWQEVAKRWRNMAATVARQ